MKISPVYMRILDNRLNFYGFLSRVYLSEVDESLFQRLKTMDFPEECAEPELSEGYRLIRGYISEPGADPITDLAVDYARVFLGAGSYDAKAAFPYASVYVDGKRLMMQEARDRAVETYAARGLRADSERLGFPEDHLALMLEYMTVLCEEAKMAAGEEKTDGLTKSLKEQLDYLEENLLNWIGAFCADIDRYSQTAFYKGIGKATKAFLRLDREILKGLLA